MIQVETFKEHEVHNPLKSLFIKLAPVCNAAVKATDMDEVKAIFFIHPFIAAIVDLKL